MIFIKRLVVVVILRKTLTSLAHVDFSFSPSFQEVEHCRAQIIEAKGPTCPIVVVLNKRDLIRSGSESSESSAVMDDDVPPASGSRRGSGQQQRRRSSFAIDMEDQAAVAVLARDTLPADFLCPEMVESLVTCDWGHGFVPASAKTNFNVVQVCSFFQF